MNSVIVRRITLRMIARMGPLTQKQLRQLLGSDWRMQVRTLQADSLVHERPDGSFEATPQGLARVA